jgi:hypothetical protein
MADYQTRSFPFHRRRAGVRIDSAQWPGHSLNTQFEDYLDGTTSAWDVLRPERSPCFVPSNVPKFSSLLVYGVFLMVEIEAEVLLLLVVELEHL